MWHLEIGHEVGTPILTKKIENLMVQSLEICGSEAATHFKNNEDLPSLILIGLLISGKDFNIARCTFASFKGTLEET